MFDPNLLWQRQPLPWHRDAFARLTSMAEQDRLPHALLLTGPKDSGKGVFARALSAWLLCHRDGQRPCGDCDGCRSVASGAHGDLRWLQPDEGKRAIGIDPVRDAIRFVQQTAGYGSHKVLVVRPAESMTLNAANALLKTLEEPAGNSLICLVSDRAGDLPVTVRSRCQSVLLPAPSRVEALEWLGAQPLPDGVDAGAALDVASGAVLEALTMAAEGSLGQRIAVRDQLLGLLTGQVEPLDVAASLAREDTEMVLELAAQVLQIHIRSATGPVLQGGRGVFDAYRRILGWLAGLRRGVNLARDSLIQQVCFTLADSRL